MVYDIVRWVVLEFTALYFCDDHPVTWYVWAIVKWVCGDSSWIHLGVMLCGLQCGAEEPTSL